MVPISLVLSSVPTQISLIPTLRLGFLGLFSTGIATLTLVYLIKVVGPSFLSLVNYQVPLWAVIIGSTILSEPLPDEFLLALVTILIGLVIANPIKLKR